MLALNGKTNPALIGMALLLILQSNTPNVHAGDVRFCGQKLVQMVLRICNNCVYGFYVENAKRSINDTLPADRKRVSEKRALLSASLPSSRTKRGIVDECCINPCTFNTLKSYCCTT